MAAAKGTTRGGDRAVWLAGEFHNCLHYVPKSLNILPGGVGVEGLHVQEGDVMSPEVNAFEAVVTHVHTYDPVDTESTIDSSVDRFDQQVQLVYGYSKYQSQVLKPVTLPVSIKQHAGYLLSEELKLFFQTFREPPPQSSYEEIRLVIAQLDNYALLCKRADEKFVADDESLAKLLRTSRQFLVSTVSSLEVLQAHRKCVESLESFVYFASSLFKHTVNFLYLCPRDHSETPEISPENISLLHTAWKDLLNNNSKPPAGVKELDWLTLKKIMGSQSGYYLGVLLDSEASYRILNMEPESLSEYLIEPQEVQVNPFVPFDISSFMTEQSGVLPFFRQDPHTCVTFSKLHGLLFELGKAIVVAKSVDTLFASPSMANSLVVTFQQLLGLIKISVQALATRTEQFHNAWKAADKKRQFSAPLCSFLVDRIQSDLQAAGSCLQPLIPPDSKEGQTNSLLEAFKRHLARILPALSHETEQRTKRTEEQSKADQYVSKGQALLCHGQCDEAMQYFRSALDLCPGDLKFRIAFAEAQELQSYASGQHLRAFEELKFVAYAPPINDDSLVFIRKHMITPLCCLSLRVLALDRNQITQQGARQLFKDLPKCSSLKVLSLSHNMLGDNGAQLLSELLLPSSAKALLTLEILDISHTGIANAGAQALAIALAANTSLIRLECKGNPLGDEGVAALASAIYRNPKSSLTYLGVSDTGYGKRSAVQVIMLVEARRTLDVDVGNLTLAVHPVLTADIWSEMKLQLQTNRSKGGVRKAIPIYTSQEEKQLEALKTVYKKYYGADVPVLFTLADIQGKKTALYRPGQQDYESSRYLFLVTPAPPAEVMLSSRERRHSESVSKTSSSVSSRRRSEMELPHAPKASAQLFVADLMPFITKMLDAICKFQAQRQMQYSLVNNTSLILDDPVTLFCEEMKMWLIHKFLPLVYAHSTPDFQVGARPFANGQCERHQKPLTLPFDSVLVKTIKIRRAYLQSVKEESTLENFALEILIESVRVELEECVQKCQQLWLFETLCAALSSSIGQGRALTFAVLAHISQIYFTASGAVLTQPPKLHLFRDALLKLMDEKHDENAVRLYSFLSTPFVAILFPDSGLELNQKNYDDSLTTTRNPYFDGTRVGNNSNNTKPVIIHTQEGGSNGEKKGPKERMESAMNATVGVVSKKAVKGGALFVGAMKKIVPIPQIQNVLHLKRSGDTEKEKADKADQKTNETNFDTLCLLVHELGQLTFFLIAGRDLLLNSSVGERPLLAKYVALLIRVQSGLTDVVAETLQGNGMVAVVGKGVSYYDVIRFCDRAMETEEELSKTTSAAATHVESAAVVRWKEGVRQWSANTGLSVALPSFLVPEHLFLRPLAMPPSPKLALAAPPSEMLTKREIRLLMKKMLLTVEASIPKVDGWMWELVEEGGTGSPHWVRRYFILKDRVLGFWDSEKEYKSGKSTKRPLSVLGSTCKTLTKKRTCNQGECPCTLKPKNICPDCLHASDSHNLETTKEDTSKHVFHISIPKTKTTTAANDKEQRSFYFGVATQKELEEWVGAIDWNKDQDMMCEDSSVSGGGYETKDQLETVEELERQRRATQSEFEATRMQMTSNTNPLLNKQLVMSQAQKLAAKLQQIEERLAQHSQTRVVKSDLTDAGVSAFADEIRKKVSHITKEFLIDISFSKQLTSDGLRQLCESLAVPQLRVLKLALRCSPLTATAGASCIAREISDNSAFASLTHLDLNNCAITAGGAKDLAQVVREGPLVYLDLGFNPLGDKGVIYLSEALRKEPLNILRTLHLGGCDITEKGGQAIRRMLNYNVTLHALFLHDNPQVSAELLVSAAAKLKRRLSRPKAIVDMLESQQHESMVQLLELDVPSYIELCEESIIEIANGGDESQPRASDRRSSTDRRGSAGNNLALPLSSSSSSGSTHVSSTPSTSAAAAAASVTSNALLPSSPQPSHSLPHAASSLTATPDKHDRGDKKDKILARTLHGTVHAVTAVGKGTLAVGKGTVGAVTTIGKGTLGAVVAVGKGTVKGVGAITTGTVHAVEAVASGTVNVVKAVADVATGTERAAPGALVPGSQLSIQEQISRVSLLLRLFPCKVQQCVLVINKPKGVARAFAEILRLLAFVSTLVTQLSTMKKGNEGPGSLLKQLLKDSPLAGLNSSMLVRPLLLDDDARGELNDWFDILAERAGEVVKETLVCIQCCFESIVVLKDAVDLLQMSYSQYIASSYSSSVIAQQLAITSGSPPPPSPSPQPASSASSSSSATSSSSSSLFSFPSPSILSLPSGSFSSSSPSSTSPAHTFVFAPVSPATYAWIKEKQQLVFKALFERASLLGMDKDEKDPFTSVPGVDGQPQMSPLVLQALHTGIAVRLQKLVREEKQELIEIAGQKAAVFEGDDEDGDGSAAKITELLSDAVDDLLTVHEKLKNCFPPSFNVFAFFQQRYHLQFLKLVQLNLPSTKHISVKDCLAWMKWICWYDTEIKAEVGESGSVLAAFDAYLSEYFEVFLKQQQDKTASVVSNVLAITRGPGTAGMFLTKQAWFTTAPQDIFELLGRALKAMLVLPAQLWTQDRVIALAKTLAGLLTKVQQDQCKFILSASLTPPPGQVADEPSVWFGSVRKSQLYLIAQINNAKMYEEYFQSLIEEPLLDKFEKAPIPKQTSLSVAQEMLNKLKDLFYECGTAFTDIAMSAINILVKISEAETKDIVPKFFTAGPASQGSEFWLEEKAGTAFLQTAKKTPATTSPKGGEKEEICDLAVEKLGTFFEILQFCELESKAKLLVKVTMQNFLTAYLLAFTRSRLTLSRQPGVVERIGLDLQCFDNFCKSLELNVDVGALELKSLLEGLLGGDESMMHVFFPKLAALRKNYKISPLAILEQVCRMREMSKQSSTKTLEQFKKDFQNAEKD